MKKLSQNISNMKSVPEYYLCSKEVTEHFPDIKKSRPFKSGYSWDVNEYFVIETFDFKMIEIYFKKVIKPYNDNSICRINFWLREVCVSQVDAEKITLKECKELGLFAAIENRLSLTSEINRAYAIFSLSERFNCKTPIDFINKISKN